MMRKDRSWVAEGMKSGEKVHWVEEENRGETEIVLLNSFVKHEMTGLKSRGSQ